MSNCNISKIYLISQYFSVDICWNTLLKKGGDEQQRHTLTAERENHRLFGPQVNRLCCQRAGRDPGLVSDEGVGGSEVQLQTCVVMTPHSAPPPSLWKPCFCRSSSITSAH